MANHNLGTIRGTIEIDYDGAGIVRAIRDTEKAKGTSEGLEKASNKVLGAFGRSAKGATLFAGALNLVIHGGQLVASTVAILAPIMAAAFATAPGIALAFGAALAVVKISLLGVGDALKAAGKDAATFNETIKNLSPEAQKFAKAYRAALPDLKAVQKAMQDAFFGGAGAQIDGIVKRVTSLRPQAVGVAAAIGQIAQNVVAFATSSRSIENIRNIMSGLNAFLLQIRGSIGPVVQAFISLGAQVSTFGGTLGGTVNGALAKLADWLNRIDVAALFERALPILKSLGDVVSNVADIFTTLFSGLSVDGNSAASILATLTGQLAGFLHTAEGQAALQALGTALSAISTGAGQIFLALLQALAPAIVALAPGITILAGQISGFLVPAIGVLAPLLQNLATFLSENMTWIGPLAGAVVALAAAYKVYAAIAGVVTALKNAEVAANIRSVAAWVANATAIVANRVAMAASAVAMVAVRAATIAWTAVQWLLNAALAANPIGLVIIGIAALVAVIILAWKHSQTFRNVVIGAWNAIKSATVSVWNAIKNAISSTIAAVKGVITGGMAAARNAWNNALNNIRNIARAVWSAIVSLIRTYINNAVNAVRAVRNVIGIISAAFNSARSAVSSRISSIVSLVRGLPGRISGAIGNLGSLLYNKGVQIVQGLISGITARLGALRAKARELVGMISRFLPGSPAKEGPLSGKGYILYRARRMMNDLAQGINEGAQKPAAAMLGAVDPIGRATVPRGSATRSGASTAPTTPPVATGTREYSLTIDGRTFTRFVVDAVTGAPVAVSKAADEGSRRTAWAGSGR